MKVATAAYPLDFLTSWAQYEDKISDWVEQAASNRADILVFPEWNAIELATLAGADTAADIEAALFAVSDRLEDANALYGRLAKDHGVFILAGSGFAATEARPVNRASFFTPGGGRANQEKQILTRYEREPMRLQSGAPLKLFETEIGKIGVLICYDVEFPLLGRALADCDILLIPSVTESLAGYWRVRIGAMARALENQCVTVMASLVGKAAWCDAVETSTGAGGVFGPPDDGFPSTGVLAEGQINVPGWTYAEVDLKKVARVRTDGHVLGRHHWPEQVGRDAPAPKVDLR